MASVLSTPARVRDRLGAAARDLEETLLEGIIAEQQAFVEQTLGRTFEAEDPDAILVSSAITDYAAAMALVRLTAELSAGADYRLGKLDVSKRRQLAAWLQLILELRAGADRTLDLLLQEGRARRFVFINGVN